MTDSTGKASGRAGRAQSYPIAQAVTPACGHAAKVFVMERAHGGVNAVG